MSELGLGKIITSPQCRDAIHIAIAPVTAAETLRSGQHVSAQGSLAEPHVGIVDPYLRRPVQKGQQFWLCLYPLTVTSLRHEWTHPSFDGDT